MPLQKQTFSIPATPILPRPGTAYNAATQGQHNGLLTTFLQRITSALQALFGPAGGQYVDNPNGLFFHTGDQTLAAANTGYAVQFNQTYLSNFVRVVGGTKMTADVSGVYNFQYSGCVESSSSSAKNVFLWIRRNGTDIGYSTNGYTLSGSGTLGIIAWNFNIDLKAGDYIELMWAATETTVVLTTEPPATPHTGIPASVCAVIYVSSLPETLPTPP